MPLPGQNLQPSNLLFPGGTGPFGDLVLGATSPWNDTAGVWQGYNAALAVMFETVYEIVADLGDVSQTQVATLSTPLSTSAAITSLPVAATSVTVEAGTEITLAYATFTQVFEVSVTANPGATSILVDSQVPNYAYPIGTPVQLAYIPGWSSLLDPANCPALFLPFLAQFVGAVVPIGLDEDTARAKIEGESAQHRGTTPAVEAAVQRNLTGSQSVTVVERIDASGNPNAYWFVVVVRPEEVIDAQALIADVNSVKPGGVQWTLVQVDGFTWSQAIHTWGADTFSWNAAQNTQP